jgi:uncharacterized Tic20 family protein
MNETTPSSPAPPPSDDYTSPPDASPPPPPTPAPAPGGNMDAKQWAMLLHLSQLAGVIVPGLGLAAPIVIWQIKKEQFPELDPHGKMVTNWIISLLIYCVAASILSVITCGFGALLFVPIAVVAIVFPILGGLKARDGVLWKYPLTITFLK